jgi:hypothetical protein
MTLSLSLSLQRGEVQCNVARQWRVTDFEVGGCTSDDGQTNQNMEIIEGGGCRQKPFLSRRYKEEIHVVFSARELIADPWPVQWSRYLGAY